MTKIKVLTDSLSDIPKELLEKNDITIVPLTIIFNEKEYRDFYDISLEDFYSKLESSEILPKTSQVSPEGFRLIFEECLNDYDKILYIAGSSKVTGTFQSAKLAQSFFDDGKVEVFDSQNLSFACGYMVLKAAESLRLEKSLEEVLLELESLKSKMGCIFTVDTLEYLKKGGRLSSTKATIGNLLNIKPILEIREGEVFQRSQARGLKKVVDLMLEIVKKEKSKEEFLAIAHGDYNEFYEDFKTIVKRNFDEEIFETRVGATVGVHAGPKIVAIFYIKK